MPERFSNTDPAVRPRFDRFVRWSVVDRITGRRRKSPGSAPVEVVEVAPGPVDEPSALWLGHATALLSIGGVRVLTDPVFAPRLGGFIRRNVAVPIEPEALPPVALVLISHNHRDHLDRDSVRRVEAHHRPRYVVPLGVDAYLKAWGVPADRIDALSWWGEIAPLPGASDLRVACVPAQHWSQRTPFDRNASLWGGFVLRAEGRSIYFAGDSGYFDGFGEIGRRFPKLDLALIPIGAYDPEWFMAPQHMNPEEAGRAFLAVGAARMISIHWGTYKLTDEPLDEPPARLLDWERAERIEAGRLLILPVGGRLGL